MAESGHPEVPLQCHQEPSHSLAFVWLGVCQAMWFTPKLLGLLQYRSYFARSEWNSVVSGKHAHVQWSKSCCFAAVLYCSAVCSTLTCRIVINVEAHIRCGVHIRAPCIWTSHEVPFRPSCPLATFLMLSVCLFCCFFFHPSFFRHF